MIRRNVIVMAPSRSGHNFVKEQLKSWSKGDLLVWGFEGVAPSRYAVVKKQRIQHGKMVDFNLETKHLIHTRDLLNWWASLLTYKMQRGTYRGYEQLDGMVGVWNEITMEGFGVINSIPDKLLCQYDRFVTDKSYRRMICEYVDGEYSEEKLNFVPEAGTGSSFDKLRLRDQGSEMKTLERYKIIMNSAIGDLYLSSLQRCQYAIDTYISHFELTEDQRAIIDQIKKN